MGAIRINTDSIRMVMKKLEFMKEELGVLLSDADKEIELAEIEGWDDKSFFKFKEEYLNTKHEISNSLKRIEEDHLVYLKNIIKNTEELS